MIGRLLGGIMSLILYFCLATVIAETIMVWYMVKTWHVDRQKVTRMVAAAKGIELPGDKPPPKEVVPEQVSLEQILEARAVKDKNLQLREQAISASITQLKTDEQKLADNQARYQQQRAAYQKELASFQKSTIVAGRDEVRRILQTIKPKQAKEIILQMLDNKEITDVVALLSGMTDTKRGKILGEFKTPEENRKIEEILKLIRQGEPESKVAEKAQQQLQAPATTPQEPAR